MGNLALKLPFDFGALLGVAFLFGLANGISHGTWLAPAFAILVVTLALLAWRFVAALRGEGRELPASTPVVAGIGVLLVVLSAAGIFDPKAVSEAARWGVGRAAQIGSLVLVVSYFPFILGSKTESPALRHARFAGFAAMFVIGGIAVLRAVPTPDIDVWTIQEKGVQVLLEGKNPYVFASVPDTDPENDFIVPYVYPPASIYLGTIGKVLFGDVRYGLLATILVTGFALRAIARRGSAGTARPALVEDAPALFLWLTPLLFMIVERAWLDPLQVMLITLGILAYVADKKTLCAVAIGVAVSSKQSMFWLFPLAGFALGFDLRRWIVLGVAALVPLLPFLAWDFRALKHANFDFMSGLPPRNDALCFAVFTKSALGLTFPPVLGFVAAAAVTGAAVLRAWKRRAVEAGSAVDFARALCLTYFVFFFFNRWAFANYYFLLNGLAALGAAAALRKPATQPDFVLLAPRAFC